MVVGVLHPVSFEEPCNFVVIEQFKQSVPRFIATTTVKNQKIAGSKMNSIFSSSN